jgi:hypothetical protein
MYEDQEFDSFFAESVSYNDAPMIEVTAQSAPVRDRAWARPRRRVVTKVRLHPYLRRSPDRQWHAPIRVNAPPWVI